MVRDFLFPIQLELSPSRLRPPFCNYAYVACTFSYGLFYAFCRPSYTFFVLFSEDLCNYDGGDRDHSRDHDHVRVHGRNHERDHDLNDFVSLHYKMAYIQIAYITKWPGLRLFANIIPRLNFASEYK